MDVNLHGVIKFGPLSSLVGSKRFRQSSNIDTRSVRASHYWREGEGEGDKHPLRGGGGGGW